MMWKNTCRAFVFSSMLLLTACASTTNEPSAPNSAPPPANASVEGSSQSSDPAFQSSLSLCPLTSVSNAPETRDGLRIISYRQFVDIGGVKIAVAPVEKACLSSGFGARSSGTHKGIDLHNASAVAVYAAAAGEVREKYYREDYGNMVVLDHGNGVFTRYAHLESFASGLGVGDKLNAGDDLGVMGNTASYTIPRHLHYEVLTGQWGTQAGSFALSPVDIFQRLPDN